MKKYLFIVFICLLGLILRVYSLETYPAGLNADEAAIGYNAYSLLKTGMDEHSVKWPAVFRSFDDFKPAVYFYLVLPFVKFLGLTVSAVRLPSAILGSISVLLLYLITKRLFSKGGIKYIPELSALILAASPWHLQFSRGGWEVNTSLFFILLGIWAFLKALEVPKFFYLFVVSFAVSLYTYHSARIIAPLLALSLLILFFRKIFPFHLRTFVIACIVGVVVCLPLAGQMLSKEGQSRFSGVSVFSDPGPLWQALEQRRGHEEQTLFTKSLHNRYLSYSLRFTKNYLSHFSPRFLFINGDEIARSKVPGFGQTLIILAPFLFIGLLSLLKLDSRAHQFILFWFVISPLAASLTFQSPHALRAQNMTIPLSVITALGLAVTLQYFEKRKLLKTLFMGVMSLLFVYFTASYLHAYYIHYPKELPYAWQYGFDQIAAYTKDNYDQYEKIIITDRYDQPYILMAFFLKYPPEILQKELVMTPRDKFGFSTVRNFGKYEFRAVNWDQDKKLQNTLIIAADESVDDKAVIHTVFDPAGKPMYKFLNTSQAL